MRPVATASAQSEPRFAAMVDALMADPSRSGQLTDLLREDHPIYDQRGAAAIVRMRGWLLLALARAGVSDAALLFVLEGLDTGGDACPVGGPRAHLRARGARHRRRRLSGGGRRARAAVLPQPNRKSRAIRDARAHADTL